MLGQWLASVKQLVLAGLATTILLQVFLATLFRTSPYDLKILLLICKRSFLSMPGFLGYPPKKITKSTSLNNSFVSCPTLIFSTRG